MMRRESKGREHGLMIEEKERGMEEDERRGVREGLDE